MQQIADMFDAFLTYNCDPCHTFVGKGEKSSEQMAVLATLNSGLEIFVPQEQI